jgi:hypothetical protein
MSLGAIEQAPPITSLSRNVWLSSTNPDASLPPAFQALDLRKDIGEDAWHD